jgi:hypothetical protein
LRGARRPSPDARPAIKAGPVTVCCCAASRGVAMEPSSPPRASRSGGGTIPRGFAGDRSLSRPGGLWSRRQREGANALLAHPPPEPAGGGPSRWPP